MSIVFMLRIHFTDADLRKITLAPVPNALLEAALSVRFLRSGPTGTVRPRPGLTQWRRTVVASLVPRAGVLLDLDPRQGGLLDFFFQLSTPALRDGVALAAATPVDVLAAEIAYLDSRAREKAQLRELADGTAKGRETLAHDTRRYFDSTLTALWPQIQSAGVADRALRAETLLRGGVDALLATLVPGWHWQSPTWHVSSRCDPTDVHLGGHGLILIPSYFAQDPMYGRVPGQPWTLTYPLRSEEHPTHASDTLGPLLGRTRAAVLASLRHPATTTETADRVGISLPSASQHTTVLRNAGLITTTRTGTAVLHTLTPLGTALLDQEATA
ncbi:ArsR/SmtB family transcription factor [Streptomyces naphthomycinicus]|uniref:ArsR/SmtB family transcription factor n=1 Tax=Streptomyces naphthomycinicus TaxID=2872625 RepID=UPI001CECD891|nr:winged helix-turn-helix domain-containing protein [Streptomyces sp. TML10]